MKDLSIAELRRLSESYGEVMDGAQFSTRALDSMGSFRERVAYCKKFLKYLGRGSSRMAFLMPNGHVLKLAFNGKGIAQNRVECGDYYKNSLDCFTEVYGVGEDDRWCEVEAAMRCRKEDFPRLLGITFVEMCALLVDMTRQRGSPHAFRYRNFGVPKERLAEIEEGVWDDPDGHPLLYGLYEYIGNYGASERLVSDLFNVHNWGIVVRDDTETIVVTDSGLNDDTWNSYYDPNRKRGAMR